MIEDCGAVKVILLELHPLCRLRELVARIAIHLTKLRDALLFQNPQLQKQNSLVQNSGNAEAYAVGPPSRRVPIARGCT